MPPKNTAVDQRLPSGPSAMQPVVKLALLKRVIVPVGVMRATPLLSVNHTLPSGPGATPSAVSLSCSGYSVTTPAGVICAIRGGVENANVCSIHHMLPFGPRAIEQPPKLEFVLAR